MSHHFHLRLTPAPKGLPQLQITVKQIEQLKEVTTKLIVAEEASQDGVSHYHVFGYTDACEKTIRNKIVEYFNIPKLKRGQTNGYYCLKYDAYKEPNISYVVKEGRIAYNNGFNETEIQDAIKDAEKFKEKGPRQEVVIAAAEGGGKEDKRLVEIFDEYVEEVLPKDKNTKFDLHDLRVASRLWWRKRSRLLPAQSTYQRFIVSAWLEWVEISRLKMLVEHNPNTFTREDMVAKNSKY